MKPYFSLNDFKKTYALLAPFIVQQKFAYLSLICLLFIDISTTLFFAWFFGNITDAAIHSDFNKMKWLVPLGITVVFLGIVSSFLDTYIETFATNGVKKNIKNHLLKHILRLPVKNASSHKSGVLLSHFNHDIQSIDGVIGRSLIDLIRLPLIFTAVFIYLLQIHWKLTLLCLLAAPIAVIFGMVFGLLLRNNSRKIHHIWGTMNSLLNETFQGFQVIRSFTMETLLYKKYSAQNDELYNLELGNSKLSGWYHSGGKIVSSFTYLLSLCLGAYYVSVEIMTVAELLIFVTLVRHLVSPLKQLAGGWAGFQRSITAVERIVSLLEQPTDSIGLPSYISSKKQLRTIQFKNIMFSYDESKKIFNHFNLNIPPGKVTAIVGPSGAGKSTLLNLLQGFYKPQSGQILIDGQSTENFALSELRSAIAHVPQETFLFAGTIRENLLLARPDVTLEEINKAAMDANIHDFITSLPMGYDTEIGERGVKLSGGQKQRIAIARALLKDAPILLLDEATSSLDNETEYNVKVALDQLMKNRTTLVIAHRLSTIQNADWIVVLNEGKIVQSGSHKELICKTGLYQNLHKSPFQHSKKRGENSIEYEFDKSII